MRYALCLSILLAWGCTSNEQNYRELERDETEPFQTERDPLFGEADEAASDASEPPMVVAPAGDIEVLRRDQPSLDGLSRRHWPTAAFVVPEGMPGWTGSRPLIRDTLLGVEPQQRFDAALAGAEVGNWSRSNVGSALLEPVWFARDLVTLPVGLVTGQRPGGAKWWGQSRQAGEAPGQAQAPSGAGAAPRSPAGP